MLSADGSVEHRAGTVNDDRDQYKEVKGNLGIIWSDILGVHYLLNIMEK